MKEEKPFDRLSPDNLMNYHIAVSVVNHIADNGKATAKEKAEFYTIPTRHRSIITRILFRASPNGSL